MTKMAIALASAALMLAGIAVPQSANAVTDPTAVQKVKVRAEGDCIRISWKMPKVDSGDTFGVIIRTPNWAETHRIETYKLRTVKCDLNKKVYKVKVRQYGGSWVKTVAKF
jgi:hypothetical protein